MDAEQIKCPSCGATLNADYSREKMFCSYCGNSVILKKHDQSINVNNVTNNTYQGINVINENNNGFESTYKMAEVYYNSGQTENALKFIEQAIKTDSTKIEAWQIKLKIINESLVESVPDDFKGLYNSEYFGKLLDELIVSRNAIKAFSKSEEILSSIDSAIVETVEKIEICLKNSVKNRYSKIVLDLIEEKIPCDLLTKTSVDIASVRLALKEEKIKANAKIEAEEKKNEKMAIIAALVMVGIIAISFLIAFLVKMNV